ncbi:LuxR C-terminal-related transcriptional regulator [Peribacillus frigoritolerans]|uniref:response regulator transcription factor n=1 Tax=Peribacillus frigoritolerans TaxID=450367 RepID=UPI003D2DA75B
MKDISNPSYKKILSFMDEITFSNVNFREKVLQTFENLFGYCQSVFWLCDDNNDLIEPITLNIDKYVTDDYLNNFYQLDLLAPKYNRQKASKQTVIKNLDLLPPELYEKSVYYNDFMFKYGFYYDVGVFLYDRNSIKGVLNFVRSKKEKPFSTSDIMCLEVISRFLSQKTSDFPYPSVSVPKENINPLKNKILASSQDSRQPDLTSKEAEILQLVLKGHTNITIASELFISVNTVKRHLQNLYRKFDVSNRTSLCYKFVKP